MNQKQLQYFVTVYQTQNIKTAADTLFVSRQGVSKVIRLLEEELGQPLFIRSIKRSHSHGLCNDFAATCQKPSGGIRCHPQPPHACS